jgi:hypothetical protein
MAISGFSKGNLGIYGRGRAAAGYLTTGIACCLQLSCQASSTDEADSRPGDPGVLARDHQALVGSRAPGGARRLTASQYKRTITDILGPEAGTAATAPVDPVIPITSVNAFEAPVSGSFVVTYEASALAAATAALAFPSRLAEHAPCVTQGPSDADFRRACYQQVAHRIGFLAFRRPPLDPVKDLLVDIALTGEEEATTAPDKLNAGVKYLIATILEAPSFLYSVEVGTPSSVADEFDLNQFELASRLALFLLGRGPSEDLLDRAAAGELDTPAGIRAVVEELVATPEARDGLADQLEEILQLKLLPTKGKDETLFPEYDDELRDSMREEVLRFVTDIALDAPRNFFDILDDETRFVNARLAQDIYDIPAPANEWDPVDFSVLPLDQKRAGIMTMPALLTIQSHPALNSITRRGLFVLGSLLCQTPFPVPRVDTTLYVPDDGTLREFMETVPGVCGAACHGIQDKMGFQLENFDAIGQFRTEEETPGGLLVPVDTAQPDPFPMFNDQIFPPYTDARDWAASMTDPVYGFSSCMIKHLYRNAVGASATSLQDADIAALDTSFAGSGYLFPEALLAFTSSSLFTRVGAAR